MPPAIIIPRSFRPKVYCRLGHHLFNGPQMCFILMDGERSVVVPADMGEVASRLRMKRRLAGTVVRAHAYSLGSLTALSTNRPENHILFVS